MTPRSMVRPFKMKEQLQPSTTATGDEDGVKVEVLVKAGDAEEEEDFKEGIQVKEEGDKEIEGEEVLPVEQPVILAMELPAMLTCPHSSPASGTGPSGSQLISAWSRPHVHGRTTMSPKPTTEVLTSLTSLKMKKKYTNYFILQNFKT